MDTKTSVVLEIGGQIMKLINCNKGAAEVNDIKDFTAWINFKILNRL